MVKQMGRVNWILSRRLRTHGPWAILLIFLIGFLGMADSDAGGTPANCQPKIDGPTSMDLGRVVPYRACPSGCNDNCPGPTCGTIQTYYQMIVYDGPYYDVTCTCDCPNQCGSCTGARWQLSWFCPSGAACWVCGETCSDCKVGDSTFYDCTCCQAYGCSYTVNQWTSGPTTFPRNACTPCAACY